MKIAFLLASLALTIWCPLRILGQVYITSTNQYVLAYTSHNYGNYLKDADDSVLKQTYKNWELFIIDDGSSDKSVYKIRKNISKDSRFFLIKGKYKKISKGPSEARNFGLKFVKTDLVAFCDIDDLWHYQKLEKQIRFHNTKNLDLSVTSYSRFKDKDIKSRNFVINPPKKITYKKLLRENSIPMLTVIIKTTYLKEGLHF